MDLNRYKQYLKEQLHDIEVYKWIESEKAGKDLGVDAIKEWIKNFAKKFRKDFVVKDLNESIEYLKEQSNLLKEVEDGNINDINKVKEIIKKCKEVVMKCKERVEEGKELIETEKDGKASSKGGKNVHKQTR